MAGLGKYSIGGYGRFGIYRVNYNISGRGDTQPRNQSPVSNNIMMYRFTCHVISGKEDSIEGMFIS